MRIANRHGIKFARRKRNQDVSRTGKRLELTAKESSLENAKVVVADDSPIYRRLIEDSLAGEPYAVVVAKNGCEALGLLSEHRPAMLITDWEMPDVTGIELCKKIRQDHESYTYILLLTSNTEKNQIIMGLDEGADDYLTKPFHPGELRARVAAGCRIAELHRQIRAKNRLLEELALTDALTGLPNRRAIDAWATRELKSAARYGFGFWVVVADLDHFKSVNDCYGHEAGDAVLKRFAELLKANTRASNICGRTGGEEFLIVLSHISKQNVETAVDRLRRQLEGETIVLRENSIRITASFGVSGFEVGTALEFEQLLRAADAALYDAKRSGRNRIQFAVGM